MLEPEKTIAKGQMEDELMFTEWLPSAERFIGVTTFNSTTKHCDDFLFIDEGTEI